MPTYEYHCDTCDTTHEESRSIHAPHPKKCPTCGQKAGEKFSQVFTNHNVVCLVYGNPKTIGQQAEQNAKRVGKAKLEEMAEKEKERVSKAKGKLPKGASRIARSDDDPPWFRSGEVPGLPRSDKPLDMSTVKDVTKFVETGQKS